jgi:hypothetical protein
MQRLSIKRHGAEIGWRVYRLIVPALLFFLALFLLCSTSQAQEKRYDVPIGDSPQLGPSDAPVTIIEFLDFQ